MSLIKIDNNKKVIEISVPLTSISGKVRVKIRHAFSDYGISTATRKIPFSLKHYVEWQIGYDVPIKDKEKFELTALKDEKYHFLGANNKVKTLYELSEIIYYAKQLDLISLENLENTLKYLEKQKQFIEDNFMITRERFRSHQFGGMDFELSRISYPLLIHSFNDNELSEIVIREQQYSSKTQVMLYFCFSILELKTATPLLNRTAALKEHAFLTIHKTNALVFLEILKIFGLLSQAHHNDVLKILEKILQN
ncbi:R.Pab1 family restriction endonuclease [Helicobacter pylori]|uniref:R.Pab1 family restriction endonuclease n=1 Tax=Helicobacter pylori TaxID=210 RepID=UPI00287B9BEC|nr:R.Pab1 family restriction endonuclease [Helicobacter pylori]WNE33055.1 R.Pab1 family restriction endonuclease [Helicobacter pylori]WNE34483.1 R.Pab1 family restriction endonuclease [Helicobacter pylori]WNE35908.1 R.Pab1 family restriction endonuclease [Helicobacter pylori]WNE37333.1 R.Pab1 family restriction endonuclease [Helicobacter pylori]WNE38761.1 R.Pab1 family restriction endonuclease [Helicobacter pylori]